MSTLFRVEIATGNVSTEERQTYPFTSRNSFDWLNAFWLTDYSGSLCYHGEKRTEKGDDVTIDASTAGATA